MQLRGRAVTRSKSFCGSAHCIINGRSNCDVDQTHAAFKTIGESESDGGRSVHIQFYHAVKNTFLQVRLI